MGKEDKPETAKSFADLAKMFPQSDTTPANVPSADDVAQGSTETWTPNDEQAFGEFCSLANIARDSDGARFLRQAMGDAYFDSDATIQIRDILDAKGVNLATTTGPIKTFLEAAQKSRTELGSGAPLARIRRDIARDPVLKSLPAEEMCKELGHELTHRHATQFFIHLRKADASKEGFDELMGFLKAHENWGFIRTKPHIRTTLDAWRSRYGMPTQ